MTGLYWMIGYVVTTFLSFPHPLPFADGVVFDAGVAVSWMVPVCLVQGLRGLPLRAAVLRAFAWTVLAHGAVLHFIYVVTVVYGHAHPLIGVLAPLALATYASLLGGLFALGWVWLRERGLANAWTGALLWASLDHLRAWLLTGWPWATLGYAQHLNPGLLGLAQWTGVYGLSFAIVLGGLAGTEAVAAWRSGTRPRVPTLLALACVAGLHVFGFATRTLPGVDDDMEPRTVRMAAVQGNIDQGIKWDRGNVMQTLETYERLSRAAAAEGAQVIVWPETAVPGALDLVPSMRERLMALSRETRAVLVVGSVGVDVDRNGRVERFYDSAFFVDPERGILDERYDKSHLVPFGEYVPLRGLLGRFLGAVASGIATGDVTPGAGPRAIDLVLPSDGRRVRVGVPICYELLFPHRVQGFVADGGGVLLGITNDAWYGRTGAPYQFLAMTAMRSAETGVYGVRAANTGVSALIDSGGWVQQETPIFEEAFRVVDVPIRRPVGASGGTFYVRHGDVFASACWLALAVAVGLAARRGWSGQAG